MLVIKLKNVKFIYSAITPQLNAFETKIIFNHNNVKYASKIITEQKTLISITNLLKTEYVYRMNHSNILTNKTILKKICMQTMNEIGQDSSIFNSDTMIDHIKNQNKNQNKKT